jgi:DNA polymerase III subunit delta'
VNLPWLDPCKTRLNDALEQQRLGHAPLISGPLGVGKRQLGEWLVRRILCLAPSGEDPCGSCRSCELIDAGSHPDFFRVEIPEDKKEIPVDSIRDLTASLNLTPSIGSRRVGLIVVAEAMTTAAANALLKTLEEPSSEAWLVLVSHAPGRLPATIRSRCQPLPVRPPEREMALEWLARQRPDNTEDELDEALHLATDSPLAAQELLDGDGLAFGHEVLDGLLGILEGRPVASVVTERWQQSAVETWRWIALWTGVFMQAAQGVSQNRLPSGRRLPGRIDPAELAMLWERALQGRMLTRSNVRQDLLLGKWLLEWEATSQRGT